MDDVSFHLIDTNGFRTKTKNERFAAARSNLMLNWKKNFEKIFFLQRSLSRNDGNSSKSVLEYKNLHKRAYFAIFPPYSHPILFTMYPRNKWILNLEITSRHLASHVKDSTQERAACCTCSTIICLSFDQSMIIIFRCRCCWLPLSFPKILHYLPTTAKYCHWKDLLLAKIRVRFVLSFRQLF